MHKFYTEVIVENLPNVTIRRRFPVNDITEKMIHIGYTNLILTPSPSNHESKCIHFAGKTQNATRSVFPTPSQFAESKEKVITSCCITRPENTQHSTLSSAQLASTNSLQQTYSPHTNPPWDP